MIAKAQKEIRIFLSSEFYLHGIIKLCYSTDL